MKVKRLSICLLMFLVAIPLSAQISIDGRAAAFDSLTNTLVATIPKKYFYHDHQLQVTMSPGWTLQHIDEHHSDTDTYSFTNIDARQQYAFEATSTDGSQLSGQIMFTHLPIIRLQGNFGYDYSKATLTITDPDKPTSDTLSARIKWRGGITNTADRHKRNYKIKFDDDHTFFSLRNDNIWLLDAGQTDLFRFRNKIATELWSDMCHHPYYYDQAPQARSSVRGKIVEVFLNNEYVGVYHFSENLDRKQMKLKKVTPEGQIRGCLYKAEGWGNATMYNPVIPWDNTTETWDVFQVKYPDLSDNDTTDFSTLCHAIDFVVRSSDSQFRSHVADYFDLPVIADYYLFSLVTNAIDNAGKNMFWAVYDKTTDKKLTPAVWDLDCTMGATWLSQIIRSQYLQPTYLHELSIKLVQRLRTLNVAGFNDTISQRYLQLRTSLLSTDSLTDRYRNVLMQLNTSGADKREENRWSGDSDINHSTLSFNDETDYICRWIEEHMQAIDQRKFSNVMNIPDIYSASKPHQRKDIIYNLNGQRLHKLTTHSPGIYIVNGRKQFVPASQ